MKTAIKIFGIPLFERSTDDVVIESTAPPIVTDEPVGQQPQAFADSYGYGGGGYSNVFSMYFDGEKNNGELGPIREYHLDHTSLRLRSWQLFIESEICQTVFRRFTRWVIGSGLRLQAEPQKDVLASEKITVDPETFNKSVEARFKVFAKSTLPDYSNIQNLHQRAEEAFMNAKVGGDVLVILRVTKDGNLTVQLVDGCHLGTPYGFRMDGNEYMTPDGNRVRQGIEIDATGQHVAFHVRKTTPLDYERVLARDPKTGHVMAFVVYGLRYRLDNIRGMPLITAVMETAKKLERYKEAVVGSAEERQKIVFAIEHGVTSTGKNPLDLKSISAYNGFQNDTPTIDGEQTRANIAATTNKQVVNMPNDSKLVQLTSTNELSFADFYTPNINIVCATVGIPPNVAMMLYDSNFSASRAALKDWEHTLDVERDQFSAQFYQPIYRLWLYLQILSNKITAPGYLDAFAKRNRMAIEAYVNARWEGANVPHIDPVKEVTAERLKLGGKFANVPLTTLEAATAALNGGDSNSNMEQSSKELKQGLGLGFEPDEPKAPADPGKNDE